MVDEAQELAKTKDHELVATALRTAITKHRDHIRVVFTGSSRTQLAHVFSNTDSPLYSVGAAIQDFPLLTMIATQVGVPTLDTSTIQFALRKLGEKTVLTKSPRGNYVFESDAFERWVKTLG